MSLQHFFLDKQIISDNFEASTKVDASFILELSTEDFKHVRALRLEPGEHIGVIDAENVYYECEIVSVGNQLIVRNSGRERISKQQYTANFHPKVTLCSGLAKGSKIDDVIRACTEIGVDEFLPVEFERCVVKLDKSKAKRRTERWNKIAKSAAMQSGQFRIPVVCNVLNFKEFQKRLHEFDIVYVFWENATEKLQIDNNNITSQKKIAIVIGPEGGISRPEIKAMKEANNATHVVSLGNSILRTETANIVASSLIEFLLFDNLNK